MRILDCPTKEMWADVLTKPLQGMAFKQYQEDEDEEQGTSQPLRPLPKGEECSLQAPQ